MMILFLVALAVETYTTWKIVSGGGRELNPVMKKLFYRYGLVTTLLVTRGLLVALAFLAKPVVVAFLAALYVMLAAWNMVQMARMEK